MLLPAAILVLAGLSSSSWQQPALARGEGFVETRGTQFVLNGRPFYANGFNAYWLMTVAADPSQRSKVVSAFRVAASHGLSLARTWAFSDGPGSSSLQFSPGSYNERTFQGLDFVVAEARKHGMMLILSLVNNYDSFGGRKQYVEWARRQGQVVVSDDDFFTNPLVKSFYRNHVKAVLTRVNSITGVAYKDDPAIFAWELINEPRCLSDLYGKTVQAWVAEMAAHVKSIDGNHLLEIGMEGFYGPASSGRASINAGLHIGTDFISNNRVAGVDFATVHSYPDQWLSNSDDGAQLAFMNAWLDAHIRDARAVLGKPVMITEFGKSSKDAGFSAAGRDALYDAVFSRISMSARAGGPVAGGLFWQLLVEGMDAYRDGYEVVFGEQLSISTVRVITLQSRRLHFAGKMISRRSGEGSP